MVKVRYEEGRKYFAEEVVITALDPRPGSGDLIVLNSKYDFYTIFDSFQEAEQHAEEAQKSYDEGCAFASFCR
jgi:hypothetical protein